jgi:hypothetical protein
MQYIATKMVETILCACTAKLKGQLQKRTEIVPENCCPGVMCLGVVSACLEAVQRRGLSVHAREPRQMQVEICWLSLLS